MKKKTLALLLSALLCLCLGSASAAEYTVPGLYSIQYDENAYILDNQSYLNENTDTYNWLYMLIGDVYEIDAEMTLLPGYEGFSLYEATEAERAEYLSATLDALGDYDGELIQVLDVPVEGTSIPFYIYRCADEAGAYLMSETVASGYSLAIYAYYADAELPVDGALMQELCTLLGSFKPI